ncbi:hypothetical protein TRQ7_08380 [Thermotoga sp. RQ7]|nr:hypothetical protein TRQ7_08380 [Thermotoga sp. RQ7]
MKPGLFKIGEDLLGDLFCFFRRAPSENYEKFIPTHSNNNIGLSYMFLHNLNQVSQHIITCIVTIKKGSLRSLQIF